MHECAIPGCGKELGPGVLMCWRHWQRVPKELASLVVRTWSKWKSADRLELGTEGLLELWREYQGYRQAAIDAVVGAGAQGELLR